MSKHHIKYGNKTIAFRLKYSRRKSLGITVNPDTTVEVKAPEEAEYSKIINHVKKKGRWILKQKQHFESYLPTTPPRKYVSGETHLYLGKQYRLKLYESKNENVKLTRGYIQVFVRDRTKTERIKNLLEKWYRSHFINKINERLDHCLELFSAYHDIEKPDIIVRRMKNRWGSCTPEGKIILNPGIIKAPVKSIDYVLMHELCHLVHFTHNKEFYALQSRIMPDWEKWKFRLDEVLS